MIGQVPVKKSESTSSHSEDQTRYLLIGSGRLARHLHFWFRHINVDLQTWHRSQDLGALKILLQSKPAVLLAISDTSLTEFYDKHLSQVVDKVVHFSGSFHDSRMISTHPLMSFPAQLYPLEFYSQIHWSVCGAESLNQVFPFLTNSFSVLKPEQKTIYHAACVMGGNFPILLWTEMENIFSQLNIPPSALRPYLERVLQNYLENPQSALTGPLVRGDHATMNGHLTALKGRPFAEVYHSFYQAYKKTNKDSQP